MTMTKILIVDDHAVVRRGLKQILAEEWDSAVFGEATNAGEALDLLHNRAWDVAVLDITLPGRNGLDLLREMKRVSQKLPVLVLSIHPEEQYAIRALKAGASGYVTKERAPEELVAAVRKVMGGGKYLSAPVAEKLVDELTNGIGKAPHEYLSDREHEVMLHIANGKAIKQIAHELSLSAKTISTYAGRVRSKLKVRNNAEVVRYAADRRLLP